MTNPVPDPIEFTRKIWRDEDLAQPGDPYLEALNLNRFEEILEKLVEAVNNTSGMVSQAVFETAIAGKFPLLPELTNAPVTNVISNRDDMYNHTVRYNITVDRNQQLPAATGAGNIIAISLTKESSAILTVSAAGTNRIGLSADTSRTMKPGDYMIIRDVLINGVGRWLRLTGPLLSETDLRYTLPGGSSFGQADADLLYERAGVALNLISQITKGTIGLGNVANISPLELPISNATAQALADLAVAPAKTWDEVVNSGDFRPDFENGPTQSFEVKGNCKLLAPSHPRNQCSLRIELFNTNYASIKLALDTNIANVSLVPFPADIPNYRSTILVLVWSQRGSRWLLTTLISEP